MLDLLHISNRGMPFSILVRSPHGPELYAHATNSRIAVREAMDVTDVDSSGVPVCVAEYNLHLVFSIPT